MIFGNELFFRDLLKSTFVLKYILIRTLSLFASKFVTQILQRIQLYQMLHDIFFSLLWKIHLYLFFVPKKVDS